MHGTIVLPARRSARRAVLPILCMHTPHTTGTALLHTVGKATAWGLLCLMALLCTLWGGMALWTQVPAPALLRGGVAGLWGLAWVLLLWQAIQRRQLRWLSYGGGAWMLALLAWWSTIQPQADLDWADEVAHLVEIAPDSQQTQIVHLRNVRNFIWRSDSDYTPRWEARSYNLDALTSVDVGLSYWMGPAIAHTLVSFGFQDGQHVVFSIEIRKERHEQFDALAGFFKQYEMALVAADERDILAVRTNIRGEQVHLYRVRMSPPRMRALFLAYAQQASALAQTPSFYHTLTANCTTIVWELARSIGEALPLNWRLLVSGYLPEYLRDVGGLASAQPLAALRQAGDITQRAQTWQAPPGTDDAAQSADFSRHIRAALPLGDS